MRVPTNVVTGFLGVGKTTAILEMLARKPNSERWAVLVNEYGEVSIDGALLEENREGVTVRDVTGGCVCCATMPYLAVALHLLLTEAKPHRLIVETTGLGHPSRLIEVLRNRYADRLDVRATLALVSPDDFTTQGMHENPVFLEQVAVADVLLMNKLDRTDPAILDAFREWANRMEPPKQLIAATTNGRIELEWLDLSTHQQLATSLVNDHSIGSAPTTPLVADPGRPTRRPSIGAIPACGWIFSVEDRFDESRLKLWASQLPATMRLKGIFRVADGWIVIQRVGSSLEVTRTEHRGDSRLEIIAERKTNWEDVESQLLSFLIRD